MLIPSAALLAVLMAAAATKEPVTGAFGLEFNEPVSDRVLAASIGDPPYPLPPRNLDQTPPQPVPGDPGPWYYFLPEARPEPLDGMEVRFMVLRGRTGNPIRILASRPSRDCANDMLWFTHALARKYHAEDDPFGAERPGFRQSARYLSDQGQVDVSCGPNLLIEYTDTTGYRRWLKAMTERRHAYEENQATLEKERTRLSREREKALADEFTAGDRYRLDGALGITFGEPVDANWLRTTPFEADTPLEVSIPDLPDLTRDGHFTVTLGPDRVPVRVAGEFPDPDARRFEAFARALEAKYGSPLKHTPVHQIQKISGDYLVARYIPEKSLVRLVFIDDAGRRAQKARQLAAKQERLAQQQHEFEEETAGL